MALPWADEPGPPVTVGRDPAREEAERELSKQIYTQHEPGLLRRLWNWLWDRIFGALESAAFHTPGGWVGLLVIAALVIALLVALRLRLGALRTATGPRAPGAVFTDRPRTAAEHRAAADEHARAGRWTPAVQERMRALVRSLEERALLDPRPGRTANEAAAEAARPLPAFTAELSTAATTFDAVTFGSLPAAPADHDRLRDLDERLRHAKPDLTTTAAWTAP
ncbi:DUF4129 domain-containing protein [Streptomyces litchfieldiae]|uniref:DUF4129 domain-containing protein n=1 Tax=Streptomyces litchfieldiae TaxID=3075543 RepID=A0ABU2MNT5_9ACTN|nr:DUF4129 domain-containing protein [Streptomyces sp. DSM 44938]MDT0343047.1 DUF4129 domain-containing protein [Streptomyces sp. DSM 44938]